MDSESIFKLPVINLNKKNTNPGTEYWIEASNFVKKALEEYGFFVAVDDHHDKFSADFDDSIFESLRDLFDLPTEIKVKSTSEIPYFGYCGPNPLMPVYESISIEDATNLKAVQSFANLMWSAGNHHFCEVLHSYAKKVADLDRMVSRMVFESYGVEKYHNSHIESLTYFLRFTKYGVNPNPKHNERDVVVGTLPHTDKNFITILHQNQINGLQVQLKDGKWISVDFPPSSLVIMAGDAFSAWSNGRVHSAIHRVTIKEGKEARYSLAQFSFVCRSMVKTPEELVDDDQHPLLYKPFNNFDLLRFYKTDEGQRAHNLLKAFSGA